MQIHRYLQMAYLEAMHLSVILPELLYKSKIE